MSVYSIQIIHIYYTHIIHISHIYIYTYLYRVFERDGSQVVIDASSYNLIKGENLCVFISVLMHVSWWKYAGVYKYIPNICVSVRMYWFAFLANHIKLLQNYLKIRSKLAQKYLKFTQQINTHSVYTGATVDYKEELIKSAFSIVNNPQSESACGCGSSFAAKNFSSNPALD